MLPLISYVRDIRRYTGYPSTAHVICRKSAKTPKTNPLSLQARNALILCGVLEPYQLDDSDGGFVMGKENIARIDSSEPRPADWSAANGWANSDGTPVPRRCGQLLPEHSRAEAHGDWTNQPHFRERGSNLTELVRSCQLPFSAPHEGHTTASLEYCAQFERTPCLLTGR